MDEMVSWLWPLGVVGALAFVWRAGPGRRGSSTDAAPTPAPAPTVGGSVHADHGSIAALGDVHHATVNNYLAPPEPPSGIPHNRPRRAHRFVGRTKELERLHTMLQDEGAAAVSGVAAWGHGGVGKSALVVAYSYACADVYPGGIAFLIADSPNLIADLAALAPIWKVPEHEGDLRATALEVRRALQRTDSLLVLDNLEDPDLLSGVVKDVLPTHPCRILVTTRCEHVPGMAELPLHNLTPEDAVALLEASRPDAKDHPAALERIARALEFWALGVTLVSAYMQRSTAAWEAYATALERDCAKVLQDVDNRTTRHDTYKARVSDLLDDVLETLTAAERRLLEYAALLPADRAPVTWLEALLAETPAPSSCLGAIPPFSWFLNAAASAQRGGGPLEPPVQLPLPGPGGTSSVMELVLSLDPHPDLRMDARSSRLVRRLHRVHGSPGRVLPERCSCGSCLPVRTQAERADRHRVRRWRGVAARHELLLHDARNGP